MQSVRQLLKPSFASRDVWPLAAILMLGACDGPRPKSDKHEIPPQAMQDSAGALVEPHRYSSLSDLAGAIRKAGFPCEAVSTYRKLEQTPNGSAVYKIDCLEYSYRMAITKGRSRLEKFTDKVGQK